MATPAPHEIVALCRDCLAGFDRPAARCPRCGSPRVIRHDELGSLAIAHLDCDAFYAAIEKRDNPDLKDKPVIVGGGRRGVVATACYTARLYGVRSAMPMFQALKACPGAVVVPPDMAKYQKVGREIRELMRAITPLVEPLSIDEAFLDLTGTERLHRRPAALTLAALARRIEAEIGIPVSLGLSHNKFLAKLASDLEKPRGFTVIGRADTRSRLADLPLSKIWGVGAALAAKLQADGLTHIRQLQARDEADLVRRYGDVGRRLFHLSRGEDVRRVTPDRAAKSISTETTFAEDLADPEQLRARLWQLCEKLSARAKAAGLGGTTVTLKLRTAAFRLRTRSLTLRTPTNYASDLFDEADRLLAKEADGTAFRLIGVGLSQLGRFDTDGSARSLFDEEGKRHSAERAMDRLRGKFGDKAITKGRGLKEN